MREISGQARTVRELLKDQRYSVDYYQREYRWQLKQVTALLDDLVNQFFEYFSPTDERSDVQKYGHYFLGSIVLSKHQNETYIVDGQQRLTTLTLLLIMLNNRQGDRPDKVKLDDMIYSEKYGKKNFNIAVPERTPFMESIFKNEIPDTSTASESAQTIVARYQDIDDLFSEEITDAVLPFFCDWLIDNVNLVEITASSDEDAYTIFETMNDRGLSLTPLDMLKGYLLSKINDSDKRTQAAKVWRDTTESLRRLGKEEDSDAIKAWLRSRYANTVRERKKGSENADFERIGSEFHRWVNENSETIGLRNSEDYFQFIFKDLKFYTSQYERIRKASETYTEGLESLYHVACFNFTLQYPLMLATLSPEDTQETVDEKLNLVCKFLDILLARRAVNYLSMTFASMSYAMFLVMKDIRQKSSEELRSTLYKKLEEQDCNFDGTKDRTRNGFSVFGLNMWSKRYIKVFLARMTDYLEVQSNQASLFASYMADGKGRYEVEHIWANHYERHTDEFSNPADFSEIRNRIGDLLLLPKTFNASYGDLPYEDKLPHYFGQNLLAKSLHQNCYTLHPGFRDFSERAGIEFRPHSHFLKADIQERQEIYRKLADEIWNQNALNAR